MAAAVWPLCIGGALAQSVQPPQSISQQVVVLFVEACVNRHGQRDQAGDFILQKFKPNVETLSEADVASLFGYPGGVGWAIAMPPLTRPVLVEEGLLNSCSVHVVDGDDDAVRAAFGAVLDQLAACCRVTYESQGEKNMPYEGGRGRLLGFRMHLPSAMTLQLTVLDIHPPSGGDFLIMTAIVPKN